MNQRLIQLILCEEDSIMRSWYRHGMAIAGALIVLSFVLAGCGNTPATSSKNGGTVTIIPSPYGAFTKNFNPFLPNSDRSGTLGMIYETLLFQNRLSGDAKPWLASGYQFNSDATTLTFTLRSNVKWSDGQDFTSADVKYTLDLMHQYPALDGGGIWKFITSVDAPDAHTVVVNFNAPAVPELWYIGGQTYIVPQHLWKDIKDPTTDTVANPVGTGPFTLGAFNAQVYTLKKNANYWQPGKPYVDALKYPAFDSNTSADLLLSQGSVDWLGVFSPDVQKTFVDRDPAHNHYWFPPSNVVALYLNLTKPTFGQLAVRQAISAAIDREALSKQAEIGYEPVASPTALVLPANKSFLDPAYANTTYAAADAAKAASILEAAGFTKGSDGVYADASGNKLEFKMNVVTGWSDWVTAVQIMATNLNAAGMKVTVNAISFNDYIAALSNGTFDTAISWTNPGPTPFYLYNSMLASSNTAPVGQAASSNYERWNDPATDALLKQYASSPDANVEQQAIAGLEKIMVEQMPTIPLMEGATWYEYSTARFVGWPDENNTYAVPAPWSFPDAEIVALTIHKA
jgi:peptide/nickel transport system substrate-binding protein